MLLGETKTAIQQWEYKELMVGYHLNSEFFQQRLDTESKRRNVLSESGKEGWELVSVTGYPIGERDDPEGKEHRYIETLYFKRPLV